MRIIQLLLVLIILNQLSSCSESTKDKIYLVRGLQNNKNWDSLWLYSDGHLVIKPNQSIDSDLRYFLINYECKLLNGSDFSHGCMTLECHKFPAKKEIDSIISKDLLYKKKYYHPFLITNIYEFKNEEDYKLYCDGW